MVQIYDHFIGGAYFPTENPYTGEAWAEVARGTVPDAGRGVVAAKAALPGWAGMKPSARRRLLVRLAELIERDAPRPGVWTRDIGRAIRAAERLQAGTVWVNTYRAVSSLSPFGGYKRSGLGRESGLDAIYEYLQTKSVWMATSSSVANPFVIR